MLVVGLLEIELHIPFATSLKGKRMVVRSLVKQLQNKFHLAVAEVGFQDLWQRSLIGASYVAEDAGQAARVLEHALRWGEGATEAEIISHRLTVFHPDDGGVVMDGGYS